MSTHYTIFLNFGYAEDSSVGYLPFDSMYTYDSAKEAFQDLAKYLKECYLVNVSEAPVKPCCIETASKLPNPRFCAVCGAPITKTSTEFDEEAFEVFLSELPKFTINDFPIEWNPEDRWQLLNTADMDGKVVFVHETEKCVLAALGYCLNENTFDGIFEEERTRYGFYG